jgi:hypothetical protein
MNMLIETHSLLLAFGKHLSDRSTHLARVLSGPACERWLQSELFTVLNWSDPKVLEPTVYAKAEVARKDIRIHDSALSSDPVLRVIELKPVYPWPDNKILKERLRPLWQQLEMSAEEKKAGIQLDGIVFGVWVSTMRREERDAFDIRWRALVQKTFPLSSFDIEPKPTVLRILGSTDVKWPHKQWQVALSAVSIRRRN